MLDRNTHELRAPKGAVKLAVKEYQIMDMLMQSSRRIISKERFVEKIWGFDSETEYNNIEVYVSFVRKKLTAIGSNVQIKAMRGAGYCLEVPE